MGTEGLCVAAPELSLNAIDVDPHLQIEGGQGQSHVWSDLTARHLAGGRHCPCACAAFMYLFALKFHPLASAVAQILVSVSVYYTICDPGHCHITVLVLHLHVVRHVRTLYT